VGACVACSAFCGDSLAFGRHARWRTCSVSLREDCFIRGPSEERALSIHAELIVSSTLALAAKKLTRDLVAYVDIGAAHWSPKDISFDPTLAVSEVVRAVTRGAEVRLVLYARLNLDGNTSYVEVTKAFHLVFVSDTIGADASPTCWPPRVCYYHNGLYLSAAHALACMLVETGGAAHATAPLNAPADGRWHEWLVDEGRTAYEAGDMLAACRVLLRLEALADETVNESPAANSLPGLATTVRLSVSSAGRIESLAALSRALDGALATCETEDQRARCDQATLLAMFDAYRAEVLAILAGDSCCNFEAVRYAVQEAFFSVFNLIREHGVLTPAARPQLAAAVDYMRCVGLAVGQQVVQNDAALESQLEQAFGRWSASSKP